jgi:hypothetical protein
MENDKHMQNSNLSELKGELGRRRHKWKINIKIDLKGIAYEDVNCILLVHRVQVLAGYCEHGNETSGSVKGG